MKDMSHYYLIKSSLNNVLDPFYMCSYFPLEHKNAELCGSKRVLCSRTTFRTFLESVGAFFVIDKL